MKKYIYYILFVASLCIVASCSKNENLTFDNVNGQTLAFFKDSGSNLEVIIDSTGTTNVSIAVTTVATNDRNVTVSIVEEGTNASDSIYSIVNKTVVIPANKYFGDLTINGKDVNLTSNAKKLILKLDKMDGGIVSEKTHQVNIYEICPVPKTLYTGKYLLEQVTEINPDDGPILSNGKVVELTAPDDTTRQFDTENYPNFCAESLNTFTIKLTCFEVSIPNQSSICRCKNGADWFTNPETKSSYTLDNDSELLISFTNDSQNDCGNGSEQITYKLTKQ